MHSMTSLKKIFMIGLLFVWCLFGVSADSDTFNTMVVTVTPGLDDFGMGLFPVGTRWKYYTDAHLFSRLQHNTSFVFDFEFEITNSSMDARFAWKDGTPAWSLRECEYDSSIFPDSAWERRSYFNPRSRIFLSISQGFGINRKSGSGPMFTFTTEFNTRYALALEKIDVESTVDNLVFSNIDGSAKLPFGKGSIIPGFPWLQDTRRLWNNRLMFSLDFYHMDWIGFGATDGVSANIYVYLGPSWFANTIGLNGITSDFWNVGGSLSQELNLLQINQDNGLNWISVNLGHRNSFSYIGGDVVPEDMIPTDRFRASITDYLYLQLTGPQFIAWDCYSEFSLGLSNGLYFGHVVNEVSQQSCGVELYSGISGWLHLRLFGFMHFDYSFGYNFAGGIWQSAPGWYQQNQFRFYISL